MKYIIWTITLSLLIVCNVAYRDCEHPPKVDYALTRMHSDDNDEFVFVEYSCEPGYILKGDSRMRCDLNIEEWLGTLPTCEKVEQGTTSEDTLANELESKPRRKSHRIVDDNTISKEFALHLDMSCHQKRISAPSIPHGTVEKYERRKSNGQIFLVAIYGCDEGYELEDLNVNTRYCTNGDWIAFSRDPMCISPNDEYDGYDDEGEEENEEGEGVEEEENSESNNRVNQEDEEEDTEISGYNLTQNKAASYIEPSGNNNDVAEARVFSENCGLDNAGCDHMCRLLQYPSENEPRVECSCYKGFTIDPVDIKKCIDIDECAENNGGCEQVCINMQGGFECSCRSGLQIDPDTKTKCIDIDECQYPEIQSRCPYGCENLPGSYRCKEESEQGMDAIKEDYRERTNDITKPTEIPENRDDEEKHIGKYRLEEDMVVVDDNDKETCPENYRRSEDGQCIDIDECAEGTTGCQYCENKSGGFECTCPNGYELNEDGRTCRDIDECKMYSKIDNDSDSQALYSVCSHECVNLEGSFLCKCPENFHLEYDRRTCSRDYCTHLYNPEFNKTKCSHDCIDELNGFVCKCPEGYALDTDFKTCLIVDECVISEGHRLCHPGKCISIGGHYKCDCPPGYMEKESRCHDIDECLLETNECSHHCLNKEGSYECGCPNGYYLSEEDKRTCLDIDECKELQDSCGDMICVNTLGNYKCVCPEGQEIQEDGSCGYFNACTISNGGCSHQCVSHNGYAECECPPGWILSEDDKTCIKRNPCLYNNGGCSQICDPSIAGYCACNSGYELLADGRTCEDRNECKVNNGGCSHLCVNHPGWYECLCNEGFKLVNDSCIDVDECLLGLHNCNSMQICMNTFGSYNCVCPTGFVFDVVTSKCIDFNECLLMNGNCSHICINFPGGHQCSCPKGQVLGDDKKTCILIDECEMNNGGCSHECKYLDGILICQCPDGYVLDATQKNCIDVNECAFNNGGCSHICENHLGRFACLCPAGYKLNANRLICDDIDECLNDNGNCSNICINLLGSYSCTCESGYQLDEDSHSCVDLNECILSTHECSHICINTLGSYECACNSGYKLVHNKSCEDINECEIMFNGGCSHRCINTAGSFHCECPPGEILAPDNRTCVSTEERLDRNNHADVITYSSNVASHPKCQKGYELDTDKRTCVDINECKFSKGGCSHYCKNLEGAFVCQCPTGLQLESDQRTCVDVDECAINNGGCSHYCTNYDGGYKCECYVGHTLAADKKTCLAYNSCSDRNGGCEQKCITTSKGAKCSCFDGYILDPMTNKTCRDIDECRDDNTCSQECRNTIGSYECLCYPGYSKNAAGQCVDINECLHMNGGCEFPATCVNLLGSFKCVCPSGYKLGSDNRTCLELKDSCPPLKPPKNGEVHCTKSRHKTQLYFKSRCNVWCHKGYILQGPPMRYCNGNGQWDENENFCIPQSCPSLSKPVFGTILPAKCLTGEVFPGERCLLHCQPGYVPAGKKAVICYPDQTWSSNSSFVCVPAITARAGIVKPYIKCPRDTILILSKGQKTVPIRLEQPKTNVDFDKYVDAYPPWGKHLQTELGVGEHIIRFRARSPNSNVIEMCRTVITVKQPTPPEVLYCPSSFDVQLNYDEKGKSVVWKEPVFSNSNIKQIFKSNAPGDRFGLGEHKIIYIVTDRNGESARCEFQINVKKSTNSKPAALSFPPNDLSGFSVNRLENHETHIVCPGKPSIKVETNFPLHVPAGCYITNIRQNSLFHERRRRHQKMFNEKLRRFYSMWNDRVSERGINSLYGKSWF